MHEVFLAILENIPHAYGSPTPIKGNLPFYQRTLAITPPTIRHGRVRQSTKKIPWVYLQLSPYK